jgi:hypothetical protein
MKASTKIALDVALVSVALANELEAKLAAPAAISADLERNLRIALCDDLATAEIKVAVAAGLASISKRSSDILAIALASKAASLDLFLES